MKPLTIGLTGGIGSGKSSVLKLLGKKGFPILQTDLLGHELLKNKKIKGILARKMGEAILSPDGEVDRKSLAREVFQDPRKQKTLNELLHPAIRKAVARWIGQQRGKSCPFLVVEVPLLFERGYNRRFDRVLSVSAPRAVRRDRLLRRGWNLEEIRRRELSQWTQAQKNLKSNWVIYNRGSRKDLKYAVDRWLEKAVKETAPGPVRARRPSI